MLPHARAFPVLQMVPSATDGPAGPCSVVLELAEGLKDVVPSIHVFMTGLRSLVRWKVPLLFLSQILSPSNLVGEADVGCKQADCFN